MQRRRATGKGAGQKAGYEKRPGQKARRDKPLLIARSERSERRSNPGASERSLSRVRHAAY